MPYFAVNVTRDYDVAVRRAGNAAIGLWVRAGAWSVARLTDGLIPADVALDLGTPAQVRKLVAVGLWAETDEGYRFLTWEADGNRTRAEVERVADARSAAGRLGGRASGRSRRSRAGSAQVSSQTGVENEGFPPQTGDETEVTSPPSGSEPDPGFKGRIAADQRKREAGASSKTNPLPFPTLPYPSKAPTVPTGARAREAAEHAAAITAVVQAWAGASRVRPGRSELAEAQRHAAELIEAGNTVADVIEAARRTGADGYGPRGLGVALRQMHTDPNARRRSSRSDLGDRMRGWLDIPEDDPGIAEAEVVEFPRAIGGSA